MHAVTKSCLRLRAISVVLAVCMAWGGWAPVVRGQAIWDGGAGTGNWGDGLNWNTDTVPAPSTAIQFGGAVQTTVDTQANRTLSTLTFNAGASAFTLNNNTLTLTGIINNSSVTQTINSAVQHTANTAYTANAGTLVLAGNLLLSNSATSRTLTLTGAGNFSVSGVIANGGTASASAVTKSGAGTAVLSGVNTYGGATTVSAGILRATNASALGTGALSLAGGRLQLATDSPANFGRNTTVGTNSIIEVDRLTAGAAVTQTLGTLAIGARTLTVAAGGNIISGVAGLTFGATTVTGSSVFSTGANTLLTLGALQAVAARSITKSGAGTVIFNAASTGWITGSALTISQGTARLGASNVFGATSLTNITVNATTAGAPAIFDLNGNNQSILALAFGGTGATSTSTNSVATGAGTLTLGGTVTFSATNNPLGSTISGNLSLGAATRTFNIADSVNAADDLTVSAIVSEAAGAGLTKTGAGTLVLSGLNTYTGPTSVAAGTLSINSIGNLTVASALGAPSTLANGTIRLGATTVAGTLLYTGGAASTNRVIDLAGTTGGATLRNDGNGALTFTSAFTATGAGSKTLTLRGTNPDANTIAGAIVNNSATNRTSILKADVGTWVLSGANTYTGTTTVNNGTLRLGSSASLASTAVTVNANLTGATALLDLNGFNATVASLTFGGAGGTATSASNVSTGAGTLTLGGNVTTNATGNPLGSTLSGNLALGAATRTFTVANSTTADADLTVSAAIGGAGGLIKAGAGTLVLSGANSYAGATTVSAGILRLSDAAALGATAAGTTVANTAALELTGGITLGAESLTLSGTGYGSGALVNLSGNNTYGGAITLGASATIGSTAGTLTLSGPSLTLGANALTFAGAGDTSLQIALGGAAGFTKTGAGTLTLAAAANTTGTLILAGGTLNLGGLGQTIGTLQVTADSILDFAGASTLNLTNLTVSTGVKLTVANWVDTVDFFYALNNPGGTILNRVEFTPFLTSDTKWQNYDTQITPVPEPSTYGALLLGGAAALVLWRRRRARVA
jgi:autotransporter-associated beta strand protein